MAGSAKPLPLRRIGLGIALLAICVAGPAVTPLLRLDGVEGIVFPLLLFTPDTEYASGYSHRRFLKLHPGMTREEVRLILGAPLDSRVDTDGSERWWYSRSPGDTHYRFRFIAFDAQGIATRVESEFYVD